MSETVLRLSAAAACFVTCCWLGLALAMLTAGGQNRTASTCRDCRDSGRIGMHTAPLAQPRHRAIA